MAGGLPCRGAAAVAVHCSHFPSLLTTLREFPLSRNLISDFVLVQHATYMRGSKSSADLTSIPSWSHTCWGKKKKKVFSALKILEIDWFFALGF